MNITLETGLITATITATIAVVGFFVVHALARSRADKEYRLKKLEELFVTMQRHIRDMTILYIYVMSYAKGELQLERYEDETKKLADSMKEDSIGMVGAIKILFPELEKTFEEFEKGKLAIGATQKILNKGMDEFQARAFLLSRQGAQVAFNDICTKLEKEMFALAKAIRGRFFI